MNLESLLGLITAGASPQANIRSADQIAAATLLDKSDTVEVIDTLMRGAAIAMLASRRPESTLEEVFLLLQVSLTSSVRDVIEHTHGVMHGDSPIAKDPFQGTFYATVTRGMHPENQVANITHDELVDFVKGPLSDLTKRQNTEMAFFVDKHKEAGTVPN